MIAALKYIALFILGFAIGRRAGIRVPPPAMVSIVSLLVAASSTVIAETLYTRSLEILVESFAYTLAVLAASLASTLPLDGPQGGRGRWRASFTAAVLASLLAGVLLGLNGVKLGLLVDPLLSLLVVLAGVDVGSVRVSPPTLRSLLTPILSLTASATVGFAMWLLTGITPAVAAGMGWYTFTGPYLASIGDCYGAAVGFIANILREQLTIILLPLASSRIRLRPAVALGGVTTMDTTLPLYTLLYGPEGSIEALVNGALLTIVVPLLVPLLAGVAPSLPLCK